MDSDASGEYSVNWNEHMEHLRKTFLDMQSANELVDVTLCCDGRKITAHKIVLSACSRYFREIFKDVPCKHPVVFLKNVDYAVLADILHFIYNGEVSVDTTNLDSFLETARQLEISGLTDSDRTRNGQFISSVVSAAPPPEAVGRLPDAINNNPAVKKTLSSASSSSSSKYGKRLREHESDDELVLPEKIQVRGEAENVYVTDIKNEPSEVSNHDDDGSEDPLQSDSDIKQNDSFDMSENTPSLPEDNFKIESVYLEPGPMNDVVKTRHSNFSEDCLKCTICNKVFSHPYSLHHHKAVHSGNTQCPICLAVLSRKYNLKMHMKARHNL